MEKGKTNNPNGRPKGTPNKITSTVRAWLLEVINGNRDQFLQDLQALEPADRVEVLLKLLPYVLPKAVNPDEVEGAAFTMSDTKSALEFNMDKREIVQWYEK